MLNVGMAMISECGGRERNEDACGWWHSERQLCCVLADGAGGHGGGEQAARLTVRHLIEACSERPVPNGARLGALVGETNERVRQQRQPGTELQDMYSTVVCLVIDFIEARAHWAHVGDSRLYRFRGGRLVERTRDHSTLQALVDNGLLAPQELRTHPQRSELRSAIGAPVDHLEISHGDALEPLTSGDAFLLCSDGVWEHLEDEVLEATLAGADNPQAWLEAVKAEVRERTHDKPRHDNYSAMAAWVEAMAPDP